ncbi:filament-like plant protein 4 [Impatiens glandulifera]|uniref:filament-like plant protein 4 n=1 Tax=Impatiens glandulifera TaxID=253017 RepID=UPI001FB132DC|nr:filament-like plant protein 4 [Impatiens glandulifera]XP_047325006.1 filament-like plant protein 4 [Impatiens glandulifera]
MDRRSWPWKKRSDKSGTEKAVAVLEAAAGALSSTGSQSEQDNYKKPNYVQISIESYSHLTGLEEQVKTYEEQVNGYEDQVKSLEETITELDEKLSEVQSEITTKETLVKQHAKVADEAVSGWEKAEAEALALKNHLESVTLLKLTAEDRASHLDGALKECMRQIRSLKEDHEEELQDVVHAHTKQLDKIRTEFESKVSYLDQELLKSEAENGAISRSLQERSNMLMKISEQKSRADAEIQLLKSNIEIFEKDINSLKYELHVTTKELEIRNEEKNMSARSAEVANKQHLEGVKKIAKLEAECQRLRGLVKKKLPGPAALAQMKLEVESLGGRDYGETRLKKSPVKPSSPHPSHTSEFSFDSIQKFQKENDFLTERLFTMEEETKMLKEALATRNSELQGTRNMCAKTLAKLQLLESQQQSPSKSYLRTSYEGSLGQNVSSPPSIASMSEDDNDAALLVSELSHLKKEKTVEKPNKVENSKHLELMDDFLEMEKLANGDLADSNVSSNITSEVKNQDAHERLSEASSKSGEDLSPLVKLQSEISKLIESTVKDAEIEKALDSIKHLVEETRGSMHDTAAAAEEISSVSDKGCVITEETVSAISQIHEFVLVLGKEAMSVQGRSSDGADGLSKKIDEFSYTYDKVINCKSSLIDFLIDLSHVLLKASSNLQVNVLGYKDNEVESIVSDYIDKVALPENKPVQEYPNGSGDFSSDSTSDPDVPHEGSFVPTSESKALPWKCSFEEFEQLKLEKEKLFVELERCTQNLETTKNQLHEVEQILAEVKSQLSSAQKTNGLAETQLKCMAESYNSLEKRGEELQTEVNLLQTKIENIDMELQEEKRNHQDALAMCKDLQDELQRMENSAAEAESNNQQEKELAAAAEKLVECQENIFLLGKQLKAMRPPQTEYVGWPFQDKNEKQEEGGESVQHEMDPSVIIESGSIDETWHSDAETTTPTIRSPKHSGNKSGTPTPEKHSRGFSRFFSSSGSNSKGGKSGE